MGRSNGFNRAGYKSKKFEEVCGILEAQGYKMLSHEWTGFLSYYEIKCPKGHEYAVQWSEFNRGKRCRVCHNESMKLTNPSFKGKSREEYRNEMDNKFKLQLTEEGYSYDARFKYKNNQHKFAVKCPQGHDWTVTWNSWSLGKRCRSCFEESVRKSSEEIRQELAVEGCELIGEYLGVDKPFKYICSCGNKSSIRIRDFRKGVRCARCAGDRVRETLRLKRMKMIEEWETQRSLEK